MPIKTSQLTNAGTLTGTEEVSVHLNGASYRATILETYAGHTYRWWTADPGQVIAHDTWTPIDWNEPTTDLDGLHGGLAGATTIAAGSNGAVLPQATINVASTMGPPEFGSSGWINVTLADGLQRVIKYTGKTATSFTGCTLGAGTLLTGQTVAEANCIVPANQFEASIAEVAFDANATGSRGIRFRDTALPFLFVGGQMGPLPAATVDMHLQCVMQPVGNVGGGGGNTIEVYQSSGGALEVLKDGIASPSLMSVHIGPNLHS